MAFFLFANWSTVPQFQRKELAFFEDRRSRGLGVGRSADGKIEPQKEVNAREAARKSGEHS